MNNTYLLPGLRLSPIAVERLILAIGPGRYDSRTGSERFTVREAIAHLADWEPIFLHRLQTAVNSPGSEIEDLDEGEFAIRNNYASKDPVAEAKRFKEGRAALVAYLESLPSEAWGNTVVHPIRGEMSVYDWANCIVGHDVYHIENFTEFLS